MYFDPDIRAEKREELLEKVRSIDEECPSMYIDLLFLLLGDKYGQRSL